jgi:hypothetical protein
MVAIRKLFSFELSSRTCWMFLHELQIYIQILLLCCSGWNSSVYSQCQCTWMGMQAFFQPWLTPPTSANFHRKEKCATLFISGCHALLLMYQHHSVLCCWDDMKSLPGLSMACKWTSNGTGGQPSQHVQRLVGHQDERVDQPKLPWLITCITSIIVWKGFMNHFQHTTLHAIKISPLGR